MLSRRYSNRRVGSRPSFDAHRRSFDVPNTTDTHHSAAVYRPFREVRNWRRVYNCNPGDCVAIPTAYRVSSVQPAVRPETHPQGLARFDRLQSGSDPTPPRMGTQFGASIECTSAGERLSARVNWRVRCSSGVRFRLGLVAPYHGVVEQGVAVTRMASVTDWRSLLDPIELSHQCCLCRLSVDGFCRPLDRLENEFRRDDQSPSVPHRQLDAVTLLEGAKSLQCFVWLTKGITTVLRPSRK